MGRLPSHRCIHCKVPTPTDGLRKRHAKCQARPSSQGQLAASSSSTATRLDIDEGSSMGMDQDMDFADDPYIPSDDDLSVPSDDDLSVPSDNPHFTRTELISEPRTYDGTDFGEASVAEVVSDMLYSTALKYKISREAYHSLVNIINNTVIPAAVSDPTLKIHSAYKSKKSMKAANPVHFERHASCKNGCMMFQDDDDLQICRYCAEPRPRVSRSSGISESYVSVASISDIVASKLYHPLTLSQLLHRSTRQTEVDKMTDIFDGAVYKDMVKRGCFDSPYDVAITLGIDGFSPFNKGLFQAIIVNMIIMNTDPKDRYKKHNMSQIMMTPGYNKPKDLEFFLSPMYQELDHLSRIGIKIKTVDQEIITAKVHLMAFIGDIPAVADLVKHRGHTSYNGCRMCLVRGVVGESAHHSSGGMYFPVMTSRCKYRLLDEYKNGGELNNLIISVHLCLSWELSPSDILFIKESISSFQAFLITHILQGTLSRRCFTINIHYLGHIVFMIGRLGPLPSYSCRPLERTIGYYKGRKLSPSLPGSSLQMHLETESSLNHHLSLTDLGRTDVQETLKLLGCGDW
ncbi:hypothetical protein [Absidia glauca]|uniref:Uncharacterized protein n=1 Tax=Absidia glauca TaxID=4829 RepID=A0A163JKW0_ABSGL|nr:hypothetical protein [Absidia glauca]